jgi:hypothetical protein
MSLWFPKNPTHGQKATRQLAAPPLRSRPLQRFPAQGSGMIGRACISRPPAPSGDHNLLAPSSAPSLPALFHAGSALGVTLQSFLPPAQPYAVSSAIPLLAFPTPSGCCSTRESATRLSGLDCNRARSSPGSFPLQGFHFLCAGPAFAGPPLLRFAPRAQANSGHPLQGLSRRKHGLSLSRPPTLLGFVALRFIMPVRALSES